MRRTVLFAVMVCYLAAICTSVFAEGDDFSFNFTSDFYSKYVWRGQLLNDDVVFQPSISAYYKEFTASIWGNVDTTDYGGNNGEFTEYDLLLDYSNKLSEDSKIGYSVGTVHYHFPSLSATDTTEIYWGFNFDVPLKPFIKVYHDVGNFKGTYAQFGIGHTIEKIATFSNNCYCGLQWGASIGWGNSIYNSGYWINEDEEWTVDRAGLNDLALTLALPICFPRGWTVTPSFNYVTLIDGKLRDADTFAENSDYFFTGVSIGKDF